MVEITESDLTKIFDELHAIATSSQQKSDEFTIQQYAASQNITERVAGIQLDNLVKDGVLTCRNGHAISGMRAKLFKAVK